MGADAIGELLVMSIQVPWREGVHHAIVHHGRDFGRTRHHGEEYFGLGGRRRGGGPTCSMAKAVSARPGSMSCATTSYPAATRLLHMGAPMRPSPMSPIFDTPRAYGSSGQ